MELCTNSSFLLLDLKDLIFGFANTESAQRRVNCAETSSFTSLPEIILSPKGILKKVLNPPPSPFATTI